MGLLEKGEDIDEGDEEFLLEEFASFYIEIALELAKQNPNFYQFESELLRKVSSKFKIDEESVRYLSHPFYWSFFNNRDSPIERFEEKMQITIGEFKLKWDECNGDGKKEADLLSKLSMESTFVRLNEKYKGDADEFIGLFLEKYVFNTIHKKIKKPYLVARLESWNKQISFQ